MDVVGLAQDATAPAVTATACVFLGLVVLGGWQNCVVVGGVVGGVVWCGVVL